ncbi:MAG: PorP/SprF family type IX secretion system membrane protein [Flavobacterium sp.]|nr:PorP/SprF family type IX secretion system membrane protein [Flavobacterium sp.]
MHNKLLYIVALISFSWSVKAQDPIFTQYFIVPETMNAGFTGFLETTSIGLIHRSQWPDLNFRVDTDFAYYSQWNESMNSGFGLTVLNHRENFTGYVFTELNATYAYRVQLTDDWYFRPALELGYGMKSYGFNDLVLQDQLNIGNGTINAQSIDPEVFNARDKLGFVDVSAAMLFNTENTWVGLSMKHLNKPNISLTQRGNVPLDMFFSANAGFKFKLADYIDVIAFPYETNMLFNLNVMKQGEYSRVDLGSELIFKKFFVGVSAATNPFSKADNSGLLTSINMFGGLQYEHFKFGYSYDFNTSGIRRTGGVHELSLSYQFDLDINCLGCPQYVP